MLLLLLPMLPGLCAKQMSYFLAQVFFKSRLSSESLEPLIGLLAYLEPKLWLKNLHHTCETWVYYTLVKPGYITHMRNLGIL